MHRDEVGKKPNTLILAGNPNVGKSAIFGALTGKYVTVSNYPGTTVEVAEGHVALNRRKVTIIDTPGANSLIPMSEDECVTRDILLAESSSIVVQVADAKNIRRGLFISTQLAEFELPFVLVLNMEDEARSRGIKTDTNMLNRELGVPIVTTIATQRQGIDKLIETIDKAALSPYRISFDSRIEAAVSEIENLLRDAKGRRGLALTILAGDESLTAWLHAHLSEDVIRQIEAIRGQAQSVHSQPLSYVISLQRQRAVDKLVQQLQSTQSAAIRRSRKHSRLRRLHPLASTALFALAIYALFALTTLNPLFAVISLPLLLLALYALGDWGTHPVYGIPILLMVLFLTWLFVGRFGAGTVVSFLEETIFGKYAIPASDWLVGRLVPWGFARELLVGEYGIITMALTYALAIVLPIVGAFFIAFGMLEDSGYLPRLAVMVDRIFKAMGLSGKSVLPMILGLGCGTMAVLTARILDTRRERLIVTLLLALGIPCSAQLGVILGMLGAPGVPITATIIWLGVVLLVIFKVGWLAGKLMPGARPDFILEVPPTRLPQLGNIVVKTYARVQWYIKEAVPLFIAGTLVLFAADKLGLLVKFERIAAPAVQGMLGLPAKATEAFIIGFLRRDYGVAGLYSMRQAGQLDTAQMVVALVTVTLFVPCLPSFLVIIKERGLKAAFFIILFIIPYALIVGGLLNWVLRATGMFL